MIDKGLLTRQAREEAMRECFRPSTVVVLAALLVMGAFAALAVAQEAGSDAKSVSVVGTVVAADWDDSGNVVAVNIQTDEDEYVVADTDAAKGLLPLVGQRVRANGTVTESGEGTLVLTVTGFSAVEESS
jgi:hypothetical protein